MILWSLSSSEAVQVKIKESYKQSRHDDDLNQPLSVQPWGRDGLKRRYWLIEGLDDTHFRLYRESNPALKTVTWWSVAGSIPELQTIADKLGEEKSTNSKKLCERIRNSIPRFESSEEVCLCPLWILLLSAMLTRRHDIRNGNDATTELRARPPLLDRSLASLSTRVVPVERSLNTRIPTMRTSFLMMDRRHAGRLETLPALKLRQKQRALGLQQVGGRSVLGPEDYTVQPCLPASGVMTREARKKREADHCEIESLVQMGTLATI